MLFNNKKCRALTPDVVSTKSGMFLHQFKWLENESSIGNISKEWNFLVGEEKVPKQLPKLIHYTLGGPYFNEYKNTEYSGIWKKYYNEIEILKK